MIASLELLNRLKDFGLNTYESKLWVALLSRGVSTAGELGDIANVPRSRTYDVLESLEKKGFIIMKLGKPIKYIAVQPDEVVDRVQRKITDDAEIQAKVIEKLKTSELLAELNTLHTNGIDLIDPANLSAGIKGRTNIYHQMESMIKNAKKSIIIFTTSEGVSRKAKALKNSLRKAKENGVKIVIASPQKTTHKDINDFVSFKKNKNDSARFCIADDKELLFMVLEDKDVHPSYDIGIWISSPYFVKSFSSMAKSFIE